MKPERLRCGDTIAVVSPSWEGARAFPHRVEQAIQQNHALGLQVRLAPCTLNQRGHGRAGTDQGNAGWETDALLRS
jgi:muramoyltetrapeptide carboxypeptidase LdcA involved in peptidoglycan recycling